MKLQKNVEKQNYARLTSNLSFAVNRLCSSRLLSFSRWISINRAKKAGKRRSTTPSRAVSFPSRKLLETPATRAMPSVCNMPYNQ